MRAGGIAVLFVTVALRAVAVDRSKFRTCEQGSFCRRFRKWIQRPGLEQALWSVVPESKEKMTDGGYSFKVKHTNEAEPHLLLKLNAHATGIFRVRLNEIEPVSKRHEIPPGDVVVDPPPAAATLSESSDRGSTVFTFTTTSGANVRIDLHHSPVSLDVAVDGVLVQRLNSRNFMNFERYRAPKESRPPDAAASLPGADDQVIDSAWHPHDLDTKGLWEEDFGGHTDRKPRGPASLGMDMSFEGQVPNLFGLSEHMTKAALPFYDEPYRFYNLDVFEYENNEPMALYGAIPYLWGIHRSSGGKPHQASGFLWLNPSETFVKLERQDFSPGAAHTWWVSESGVLDANIFVGPKPADVSAQFHTLTGLAPMPGMWALGKHQCRWNYMSQKDVATVDGSFDKYDLPYDTMWLDIEHTDGKAYFTWNSGTFPDPSKMLQDISNKRRKFVNVVDPHIKKDEKFHVFTDIRDKGLFIKKVDWKFMDDPKDSKPADWVDIEKIPDPNATVPEVWNEDEDGKWEPPKIDNPAYKGEWKARQITDPSSPMSDFEGWCWPGTSGYPDFTDPNMREYWGSQFALDKYKGTNKDLYIWNDMNEPSVFNGPEVTMPRDAIHPHGNVEHRDVHNMYGYYVHRSTYEGLLKRVPGDRPFVLTRSYFVGSHKFAAIWTGDNYAKWEHLRASIAMIGALTLGGVSLVGADVGGFFAHPDAEMVTRWYQLGVFAYPFLRNHAHLETPRREPYMYDNKTMAIVRESLQYRYQMLPLWYTLFQDYHIKGLPVVRPLFFDFLEDDETHTLEAAVEDQIMLGNVLLVHGVSAPLSEKTQTTVYLPKGAGWYDFHTGSFATPGHHQVNLVIERIPAYYRAGVIVPLKSRMRRSSSCMSMDPFTISVYLDPEAGTARGRVYVDDYSTQQYKDGKSFLDVSFEFSDNTLRAVSTTGELGDLVATQVERVNVFGSKVLPSAATLFSGNKKHTLTLTSRETPAVSNGLADAVRQAAGLGSPPLYTTSVKIKPWIDLKLGTAWSLQLS